MCNLGFWQEFLLSIQRGQFGILEGVPSAYLTLRSPRSGPRAIWDFGGSFLCLSHFMLSSEQTARNLGFWQEFLMCISLFEVLSAGRGQFGILEGVSIA